MDIVAGLVAAKIMARGKDEPHNAKAQYCKRRGRAASLKRIHHVAGNVSFSRTFAPCQKLFWQTSGWGIQMKKFATISGAAILAVSFAGAAFAQGANPSAPQPSSTGAGVVQPGTTSTGTATDAKMKSGTTGMDKSGMGSKDSKDGMKKDGMSK
jgi:hypothetical protein